jgi:hypothetical protein
MVRTQRRLATKPFADLFLIFVGALLVARPIAAVAQHKAAQREAERRNTDKAIIPHCIYLASAVAIGSATPGRRPSRDLRERQRGHGRKSHHELRNEQDRAILVTQAAAGRRRDLSPDQEDSMSIRILILAAAVATPLACFAAAQQTQQLPTEGGATAMAAEGLPSECRTATQAGGQSQAMQGMNMQSTSAEGQGMTANTSEAQKGYLQSMTAMRAPMMTGIMANDPDVGFICGMIPHHQGAVDMAKAVLKTGHDPEAKRFAEQVIRDQGREIAWMKDWLKKHAKKEDN